MSIFDVPQRGCDVCNQVPSDRIQALPTHLGGRYTDPQSGEQVDLWFRFKGDWTVCATCRELVEAGDRDGLARARCGLLTHGRELRRLRPRDRRRLIAEHRAAMRHMADELLNWRLEDLEPLDDDEGDTTELRTGLEERELEYVLDVKGTTSAYSEDVKPVQPPKPEGRGDLVQRPHLEVDDHAELRQPRLGKLMGGFDVLPPPSCAHLLEDAPDLALLETEPLADLGRRGPGRSREQNLDIPVRTVCGVHRSIVGPAQRADTFRFPTICFGEGHHVCSQAVRRGL